MIKILIIIIVVTSIPFMGFAQGVSLPDPLTEAVDTFRKIDVEVNIDVGKSSFFEKLFTNVKRAISKPADIWNNANDWLEDNVGVSFREIIRAVGNLFVWALGLIIKVIQWVVSLV